MSGYSDSPLIKKLGIKEGFSIDIISPPDDFMTLLGPLPDKVTIDQSKSDLDMIHCFTNSFEALELNLVEGINRIRPNGMIWISWYKKASKLPTEINENIIRGAGLSMGLVDVKVCSIDDKWSALKFVIRKENRHK